MDGSKNVFVLFNRAFSSYDPWKQFVEKAVKLKEIRKSIIFAEVSVNARRLACGWTQGDDRRCPCKTTGRP